MTKNVCALNYSQWGSDVYGEFTIDDFCLLSVFSDGIYRVTSGSVTIDFFLNGFNEVGSEFFLVFFQGAITSRDGTSPPYFAGINITKGFNHPFILISDPTISLSESLTLSWYAGNKDDNLVPYKIARALDHIAGLYGAKLVLIGGSGGGFSVLIQSCILRSEAISLAWNPQTSIENYSIKFVSEYMKVAFDDDWSFFIESEPKDDEIKPKVSEILEKRKIFRSAEVLKIRPNIELLYLQNRHDWHVKSHLQPYLKEMDLERLGCASFSFADKAALHIGDWGQGHAPPPKEVIKKIIQQVTYDGKNVKEVASMLSLDICKDMLVPLVSVDHKMIELNPNVFFHNNDSFLKIEVEIPSLGKNIRGYECALYLYKKNKRIHVCWYQKKFIFKVDVSELRDFYEVDAVKVFVRDIFGDIASKHVFIN